MSSPNTLEPPADKRRWNAYVCQDCRGIFRVPADYVGQGVVCPVCDRMLRIPRSGESIPSLVQDDFSENAPVVSELAKIEEIDDGVMESDGLLADVGEKSPLMTLETMSPPPSGERRRRKRQRDRGLDVENSWQQNDGKKILRFSGRKWVAWWITGAALSLVVIGGIVISMLPDDPQPTVVQTPDFVALPPTVEDEDKQAKEEALRQLKTEREARAAVTKLYQATTVDALLPLLRPVDGLREKVQQYHADKPLTVGEMEGIDEISPIMGHDSKAFFATVRLKNYRTEGVVVIKVGEMFLVDWESWVGWSEMSYQTIIETKPTTPTEVRVIVEPVNYYNFDFPNSSESEWQSYRLNFADGEKELYGYIMRTSELTSQVTPASDQGAKSMILRIRYRDENSHATQVLIDSVVTDGWVKDLP